MGHVYGHMFVGIQAYVGGMCTHLYIVVGISEDDKKSPFNHSSILFFGAWFLTQFQNLLMWIVAVVSFFMHLLSPHSENVIREWLTHQSEI